MIVVAHVSDPHFGTERPPVVAALQRLLATQSPGLVVLSGDITQRARRAQFRAARAFVDGLNAPRTLIIPGNHDIALFNVVARLLSPYAGFRRFFGDVLEPVVESPTLLALGVKTTRRRRHVDGEISAAQVDRVAQALQSAGADQLRLVVVHQPVVVTRDSERHNLVHGHAEAVAAWSAAGADLILGGHIHLPYVVDLQTARPELPRKLWAVQAGTALSHRVRDGVSNSVNLIRWLAPVCVVERWDFDGVAQDFAVVAREELVVDRR
jgi:3',5'-cyclic AMP phosphodiesterase CpdA